MSQLGVNMCGDGDANDGNACDDGNLLDGDGCSKTCTLEPGFNCVTNGVGLSVCTEIADDGIWWGHLACDDGDGIDTNGCSNAGVINANHWCELGNVGTIDACHECCGNGI